MMPLSQRCRFHIPPYSDGEMSKSSRLISEIHHNPRQSIPLCCLALPHLRAGRPDLLSLVLIPPIIPGQPLLLYATCSTVCSRSPTPHGRPLQLVHAVLGIDVSHGFRHDHVLPCTRFWPLLPCFHRSLRLSSNQSPACEERGSFALLLSSHRYLPFFHKVLGPCYLSYLQV